MTVKEWVNFHSTCLIYKCQNNLSPQYLVDHFNSLSGPHCKSVLSYYCMSYPGKKVLNWIE